MELLRTGVAEVTYDSEMARISVSYLLRIEERKVDFKSAAE